MKEKTYIDDVDRNLYDFRYEEKDSDFYKVDKGLTPEIVRQISKEKNDPEWMLDLRLKSLEVYNKLPIPDWGPSLDGLDLDNIVTYVKPKTALTAKWSEVPNEIKETFEKLGIPQAERESLAGVGAQYDSEVVYHNMREEVSNLGVVYTDLESALHGEYADLIKE
ncbi:MAG: Fe-S cluster assembly protein SufB, partial [Lachnospiraceae bacterium]|nr:Fe-S cluster assembly protein SufB [Lachnospiraceae bacterium]